MKICVIIPTYNEAKTIGGIVGQIRSQGIETVVIDDGSSDNTSWRARENGAIVLQNLKNEGKGASLIRGFDYAMNNNFDAVITMDGDGQHEAKYILKFIQLAYSSDSQILIGNRMLQTRNMPILRFLTNKFMSLLISFIAKQNIMDTQCGFRLIKSAVLEKVELTTNKFETESELLIKAAHCGFKIESVPIKTIYSGEKSRISPFIDTLRFMRFIIREGKSKNVKL